jgi:flagellar biosynthesis protein FliQ
MLTLQMAVDVVCVTLITGLVISRVSSRRPAVPA